MSNLKSVLSVLSACLFVTACSSVDVGPVKNKVAETKSGPAGACIVATHQAGIDLARVDSLIGNRDSLQQADYDKAMAIADSAEQNRQKMLSNCYIPTEMVAQMLAIHAEEYAVFRAKLQKTGEILRGVTFAEGSSTLASEAKTVLDVLANKLMRDPKRAVVAGYTSSTGSPEMNLTLSQKRAESVVEYLVNQGVEAKLLAAIGYGEANPISSNDTPEGRVANQRVEITFVD
jgi:outer membrane protein OmpA-like peptidoglycan-associated protein